MLRFLRWSLVATLCSFAASLAEDAVFPPGSSIGLVPPPGMTLATSFTGFETDGRSVIVAIIVFPPVAGADLLGAYDDDAKLAQRGVTVEKRERLTVGGNRAALVTARTQAPIGVVRQWIMLVASPTATAQVVGQCAPSTGDDCPVEAIRTALMSITFRAPIAPAQQADALPFTIKPAGKFRVLAVMAGMSVVLTDGPEEVDPQHKNALFLAGNVPTSKMPGDYGVFARGELLRMQALHDTKIESERDLTIAGLPAREIRASAVSDTGVALRLVAWTVFGDHRILFAHASARPEKFDAVLPDFITMRDSMRPK